METKKHIINLPKNKVAENISIKTENNQIIVNYDLKEKFNLKEGEFYFVETKIGNKFICIYKDIAKHYFRSYASLYNLTNLYYNYNGINIECHVGKIIYIREATVQEKESLLNALAEEGIQWNAKKMCIEDIFNPKDGDFLIKSGFVFIYKNPINPFYQKVCGCYCGQTESTLNVDKCSFWTDFEGCRYATESEKQAFLAELEKYGYTWNSEKKCLEEYVWKPKYEESFYFIHIDFKVLCSTYYNTLLDNNMILAGNCFQTIEQAEKKAKELREVLKKK